MKINTKITLITVFFIAKITYADCVAQNGVKHVYFGDLHTHTSYSLDAYGVGTRVNPEDALLFAKKQKKISLPSGQITEIDRPLDFLAVTDHSEYLGFLDLCTNPGSSLYQTPQCAEFRLLAKPQKGLTAIYSAINLLSGTTAQPPLCQKFPNECIAAQRSVWQKVIKAANSANDTQNCSFTSFIAQEWTYSPGSNLHRNIIYADENVPKQPIDALNYPTTSELWFQLEKQCSNAGIGCDVLAIPHNSNGSRGLMFDSFGKYSPGDSIQDRQLRQKYEKLAEIHQHKGNSECLIPNQDDTSDCSFETSLGNPKSAKQAFGYIRNALSSGIQNFPIVGFDALQLGFVGATDTHNGTPGNVKESTWPGHGGTIDGTPTLRLNSGGNDNPGGITGVWAEVNTRPAIFAALKRRETFATSGPRISLNFRQTYDQSTDFCNAGAQAAPFVSMGGTMGFPQAPGLKPRFVIQALKDQNNFSQIDIIKASLKNGVVVEHVFPIYKSKSSQGEASLCKTFTDSEFNGEPGYWYARVLEVPTPRWSHYDCQAVNGENSNCKSLDVNIQERAWSSPIWNLP